MNLFVKNLFSKCEHIRIKLRIYSHLLNKSLTENFIFCVVKILLVLLLSLASFSLKLIASISYTLHQSTLDTDQYSVSSSEIKILHVQKGQNLQHRNYCTIINILLEYRTSFKLLWVEEVPRNLWVNYLPKQFLDTIRIGILLQRDTFCQ